MLDHGLRPDSEGPRVEGEVVAEEHEVRGRPLAARGHHVEARKGRAPVDAEA